MRNGHWNGVFARNDGNDPVRVKPVNPKPEPGEPTANPTLRRDGYTVEGRRSRHALPGDITTPSHAARHDEMMRTFDPPDLED
jgi:hypothetical protein